MNEQTNVLDILTGGQVTRTEQHLQRIETMTTIAMVASLFALGLAGWVAATR